MSDKKTSEKIQDAVDERVEGAKNQDVNKNANDSAHEAGNNIQKSVEDVVGVCSLFSLCNSNSLVW
jgi:hypothetical protein